MSARADTLTPAQLATYQSEALADLSLRLRTMRVEDIAMELRRHAEFSARIAHDLLRNRPPTWRELEGARRWPGLTAWIRSFG